MFALARAQSGKTTEAEAKHCVDSWDLFANAQSASFGTVYKAGNHLPRSKFPSVYSPGEIPHKHGDF